MMGCLKRIPDAIAKVEFSYVTDKTLARGPLLIRDSMKAWDWQTVITSLRLWHKDRIKACPS